MGLARALASSELRSLLVHRRLHACLHLLPQLLLLRLRLDQVAVAVQAVFRQPFNQVQGAPEQVEVEVRVSAQLCDRPPGVCGDLPDVPAERQPSLQVQQRGGCYLLPKLRVERGWLHCTAREGAQVRARVRAPGALNLGLKK